ncbi:hypothetical protein AURDEDRAFT_164887 [Auricularia subglabra TFB-10046 SS5]|nr:hypothetical protein AURDEDRAFT_164887 [Auricularia subglabra TFB-10046 SS5]
MRFICASLLSALLVLAFSAAAPSDRDTGTLRVDPKRSERQTGVVKDKRQGVDLCPGTPVPLYRGYSNISYNFDHIYTRWLGDFHFPESEREPDCCRVYAENVPDANGLVPLYRLYAISAADHFYTTSEAERQNALNIKFRDEGIVAWVHSTPVCGASPLYRLYFDGPSNAQFWRDHFYTSSAVERDFAIKQGYKYEGIEAYVR